MQSKWFAKGWIPCERVWQKNYIHIHVYIKGQFFFSVVVNNFKKNARLARLFESVCKKKNIVNEKKRDKEFPK